jgi:OmpA-OmpF porin, OOP family
MKKILFSALALICFGAAQAQFTYDYLRAADNYYRKGDYFSAAQYYEKYLGSGKSKGNGDYNPYVVQTSSRNKPQVPASSRTQAVYNLAESYRMLNYYVKAEPYYQQALDFDKTRYPLARYWFAVTERALEKYPEAEKAFTEFLQEYTQDDKYAESAKRELQNLVYIQAQLKKDISLFNIAKGSPGLNDTGASYAPVWMNDHTLLFTSTRPANASAKKEYINRVYQAMYSEGVFSGFTTAVLPQPADVHQGAVSLTPDGNTMFLTRWTFNNGKKSSAIYSSKKSGDTWSEPVALGESINANGANTQQPLVLPGGKYLLYASDKTGGQGGFDLWYTELGTDGSVSASSSNLGTAINTAYDEQAPYYHAPSNTLVFSTNGRVGMGGYDFFYSKGNIGNWSAPQNFGYPVNSVKDDIYFASRGGEKNILQEVLLSSDRDAACCLELFYVRKTRPLKQVTGSVMACDQNVPLAGATVMIVDTVTNKTIATKTTDAQGRYSFTIEDYQPLKAVASSTGYVAGSLHFDAPADPEQESMTNRALCLSPIPVPPVEKAIVIDNVFYDFNKSVLREESFPSLDKVIGMLNENPTMVIEISAHTDNIGKESYNQKLSEARAKSVVAYLVSKGISKDRLQAKGYGSTRPIAPNKNDDGTDNPEGRQINRRTEFKVISK